MKPNPIARRAEKHRHKLAPQAEQSAAAQILAAEMPYNTGIRSRSVAIQVADGAVGVKTLGGYVEVMGSIANQFGQGKTQLAIGASKSLPERAGAATSLEKRDPEREASALAP